MFHAPGYYLLERLSILHYQCAVGSSRVTNLQDPYERFEPCPPPPDYHWIHLEPGSSLTCHKNQKTSRSEQCLSFCKHHLPEPQKTLPEPRKTLLETRKTLPETRKTLSEPQPLLHSGFFFTGNWDILICCGRHDPERKHLRLWKQVPTDPYTDLQKEVEFRGDTFPRNPRMGLESRRLETFQRWPLQEPAAADLVRGGFYYTGYEDVVTCFYCNAYVSRWQQHDNPLEKHECQFARWYRTLEEKIVSVHLQSMKSETARLKTFRKWTHKKTPKELTCIGFFSLQKADYIQCVFCKVVIGFWDSELVKLHLDNSPTCPFMNGQNVGNEPIENEMMTHPLYPKMSQYVNRLCSFYDGPFESLSEFKLARWGFYAHQKYGVQCFWCGFTETVLRDKQLADIHAMLRPQCMLAKYIQLKENSIESSIITCKICLANESNIVFKPCGHLASCTSCAKMLLITCPICRNPIEKAERVYIA